MSEKWNYELNSFELLILTQGLRRLRKDFEGYSDKRTRKGKKVSTRVRARNDILDTLIYRFALNINRGTDGTGPYLRKGTAISVRAYAAARVQNNSSHHAEPISQTEKEERSS